MKIKITPKGKKPSKKDKERVLKAKLRKEMALLYPFENKNA